MVTQAKATLVSWTANPVETMYAIWKQSRDNLPLMEIRNIDKRDPEVRKVFEDIVTSALPLVEHIQLVFVIEDMPISLREQIVRHRIGSTFPGPVGADSIPELGSSTFWSQSSRYINVGEFYLNHKYHVPEAVANKTEALAEYDRVLYEIERGYNRLVAMGIPLEDARGLIPLCMTHRMSWGLNIKSLSHIAGHRGCWLAQAGLWEPLVRNMIEEVATKIDPIFRRLIDPPCFKQGQWQGCPYRIENQARVNGKDEHPPCPLYLRKHDDDALAAVTDKASSWFMKDGFWVGPTGAKHHEMARRVELYGKLWGRNPWTGEVKGAANS
jgi:thymidylate synthase ThyX